MIERKHKEMEDRKRKISGPQPRSSNRPRFSGNPPQQFKQNQRPPQQRQFQRQYPQHQQQNRQNNQSGGGQIQRQNQQAPRLPCPSNPAKQSSGTSSKRQQGAFPLWRARPLGDAMFEEGILAAVRPQCPSKAECVLAWSRQPLLATLQPWETEPLGG
jgi:hypothetical protein